MKLLFPEVEVTKSLSSNLLKSGYTNLTQDDARVINVNELMLKRLEALGILNQQSTGDGFVSGLTAEVVETDGLLNDEDGIHSNVIKSGADAENYLEQVRLEAEEIIANANAQAEEIKQLAASSAEQEKTQVLEQARQQGYAEGMEQTRKEAARLEAEYAEKNRLLEREYQQLLDELEPQFVDTITGIYEHIFGVELQTQKEILCHLIASTMRKTEGNRDFLVHVSKEDFSYVSEHKAEVMEGAISPNSTVEIVEDVTLAANECLIETEGGIFDCGLGTQLVELRQKLKLLSYEK